MSKSMLLIDTPEKCDKCPLCNRRMEKTLRWGQDPDTMDPFLFRPCECRAKDDREIPYIGIFYKRPDWCPLKEEHSMIKQYAIRLLNARRPYPKYFDTLEEAEAYRLQRSNPESWVVVSRTVTYGAWEHVE